MPWSDWRKLALSLIMLTALDGAPIWVESTAVVIIKIHGTECHNTARAIVKVGSTGLCVRETPDQIREKIKNAD